MRKLLSLFLCFTLLFKLVSLPSFSQLPSDNNRIPISLPQDFLDQWNNMLSGTMSGSIQFKVPKEWEDYKEVFFTVHAGDETATCSLMIESNTFFNENSTESDFIMLDFVSNGSFDLLDPLLFGNTNISSLSYMDSLSLSDFKSLLKDLRLIKLDNNSGFDLETQEATFFLLNFIDSYRCLNSNSSGLSRKERIDLLNQNVYSCSISTTNYLDYINKSIPQNIKVIALLVSSLNGYKKIGESLPPINYFNLEDTPLLRAFASAGTISIPAAPGFSGIVVSFLASLVITSLLRELDLEIENTTTCKNTYGFIDRRFFLGKDFNNIDIPRSDLMINVTEEGYNIMSHVIPPFPHIPNEPGIYKICLNEGNHNLILQFNDQNTFSMTVNISSSPLNIPFRFSLDPFTGGVFRKYGTDQSIQIIIGSKRILDSTKGDLKSELSPNGVGAYLTNLSIDPNSEILKTKIAESLRLYKEGSFENGNPDSKGIIESDRAAYFIDLAINTNAVFLDTSKIFPLQFILPNTFLDFGLPGEKLHAILINKNYNGGGTQRIKHDNDKRIKR